MHFRQKRKGGGGTCLYNHTWLLQITDLSLPLPSVPPFAVWKMHKELHPTPHPKNYCGMCHNWVGVGALYVVTVIAVTIAMLARHSCTIAMQGLYQHRTSTDQALRSLLRQIKLRHGPPHIMGRSVPEEWDTDPVGKQIHPSEATTSTACSCHTWPLPIPLFPDSSQATANRCRVQDVLPTHCNTEQTTSLNVTQTNNWNSLLHAL